MKKTVLAIAVGAALATAGVAQAEVKIFGKAHVSVDSINSKDAAAPTKNKSYMYVSSNSSSLGFSAEEDMGDGMKAGLMFDSDVTMDKSTTGTVFGRQTIAYLAGGFGNVTIGKIESPMKLLGRKADFFGDQVGDSRNMIADKATGTCCGFDNRPGNAIQYTTPAMGGAMVQVLYTPEEGTKDGSSMTLRLDFSQGPVFVGAAYESHGNGMSGLGAEDESAVRIAGSYAMGDAKIGALVQMVTNLAGTDGADRTTYGIGGSFKVSATGTVKAQVYMAGELDTVDDTEGTLFALGYDHAMSKNTTVYAAFASVTNGDAAAWNATGAGHGSEQTTTPATGEDSSGISFGLIHKI